jgi:hypothetical protein
MSQGRLSCLHTLTFPQNLISYFSQFFFELRHSPFFWDCFSVSLLSGWSIWRGSCKRTQEPERRRIHSTRLKRDRIVQFVVRNFRPRATRRKKRAQSVSNLIAETSRPQRSNFSLPSVWVTCLQKITLGFI